jgi:hypothetical protein
LTVWYVFVSSRAKIDLEQVKELAAMGLTVAEIAASGNRPRTTRA